MWWFVDILTCNCYFVYLGNRWVTHNFPDPPVLLLLHFLALESVKRHLVPVKHRNPCDAFLLVSFFYFVIIVLCLFTVFINSFVLCHEIKFVCLLNTFEWFFFFFLLSTFLFSKSFPLSKSSNCFWFLKYWLWKQFSRTDFGWQIDCWIL